MLIQELGKIGMTQPNSYTLKITHIPKEIK